MKAKIKSILLGILFYGAFFVMSYAFLLELSKQA